jgi:hypothetical protein
MPRPKPPQKLLDDMAAMYNAGKSVTEVARVFKVPWSTAHMYISQHPTVTMRGFDGNPRVRPTGRTVHPGQPNRGEYE